MAKRKIKTTELILIESVTDEHQQRLEELTQLQANAYDKGQQLQQELQRINSDISMLDRRVGDVLKAVAKSAGVDCAEFDLQFTALGVVAKRKDV